MRIFLDANILFSASKSDGAVHQLLKRLVKQKHVLCADEYVMIEARRNLSAKAGHDAIGKLDALLKKIEVADARTRGENLGNDNQVAWLPAKDQPVMLAAMRMRCDALVTGDVTHFGKGFGKSFGGITLYSPRMLFDVVSQSM